MIDLAKVKIIAGSGGNGCISFRRTRSLPKGGPNGGDGGNGGNVYVAGDDSINTLIHLRYRNEFKAGRGKHGGGNGKYGARGTNVTISVPIGTMISTIRENGETNIVTDVLDETPILLGRGGKGGRGNMKFVSPVNQIPLLAEGGGEGDMGDYIFELKLLADVGIVGMPNAGKSTLLSVCSAAKPKVASYPFTTLDPVLGMVDFKGLDFLLVEIPGLIKGAHTGVGLGHEFLKHATRTRVLWHLVDGSSDDVTARIARINTELSLFSEDLTKKPQIIVINKMDTVSPKRRLRLEAMLNKDNLEVVYISAVTRQGIGDLLENTIDMLRKLPKKHDHITTPYTSTMRPKMQMKEYEVKRVDDTYIIDSPKVRQLIALVNLKDRRVRLQLWKQFEKMGISKALVKEGVQSGDTVMIGKIELEWE